jgi:predicted deacylase
MNRVHFPSPADQPSRKAGRSSVVCTSDLWSNGKRSGTYYLRARDDESAYRRITAPIGIIANGPGPRAILMGGVHGDEFHGQIAVRQLFAALQPDQICGSIVFLPAANPPAAYAGKAMSPLDGKHIVRGFAEKPVTITDRFGDFYERDIFAGSDLIVDLHSGGKSLVYVPGSLIIRDPNADRFEKQLLYSSAFGASARYIIESETASDSFWRAAERCGAVHLNAELGGSLYAAPEIVAAGLRGVLNVLSTARIFKTAASDPVGINRIFHQLGQPAQSGTANRSGLVEYLSPLGCPVARGKAMAVIHPDMADMAQPRPLRTNSSGIVVSYRANMRTQEGDCLWEVASPVHIKHGQLVPARGRCHGLL